MKKKVKYQRMKPLLFLPDRSVALPLSSSLPDDIGTRP
jgi:hypothetical protein